MTSGVIMGIYCNRPSIESAIMQLRVAGFDAEDLSALFPVSTELLEMKTGRKSAAAIMAGATVGGAIGWILGTGMVIVPGLGALVAAGPLLTALAGFGTGGILAGLCRALVRLGFGKGRALWDQDLRPYGGYQLSVHCKDEQLVRRAVRILGMTRAREVSPSPPAGPLTEVSELAA